MEGLFMLQGHVRRAASGGFLRSQSNLVHSSSGLTFDCSECSDSECGGNGPSSRRIALAKRVLSEATRTFTPCLSISAQKADMCKNTGAIGPLMIMIQSESDNQALRCCLDTLSFLLLDKANRVVVQELSGLSLLMSLFLRETDWTLLRIVLDCVCSLVKNDDAEKEFVWSHAGKVGILGLMNAHASAPHLLEVLCHVRKIAFKGEGQSMVLLEPQLLLAASCILAKHHQPQAVVNKVCKFLRFCAQASCGPEHVELWGLVLPLIVPLLRDPCSCEGALAVLLSLSEHAALKHLFASVGIVPPVVFLMLHPTKAICVTASCVISALAEDAGPCRSQLSSEACIAHLLRALSATEQYPDVAVAVIYTLNKLVKQEPQSVTAILTQRGAPRLLMRLMPRWTDTELTMGAMQLIEAMGIDPEALFASSSTCSSTSCTPQHSYSMGGPSLGLEISATSLQTSASSSLPIPSPMSVPAFDRTVSCNIEMTDALGMPLRKKPPSRQISSDSEGPSSSGMSFSTPMQQGRADSGVEFSEAVSPVAGARPSIWNTSATATAFLSLQSRPRVACLPDSEAALATAATHAHLQHTSRGESSAEASLYPSRSASPCAVRAKLALLPQSEPQGQQEASTRRVSNFTSGQIVLPAEPRSCVGVRSWSANCLLSLDGRILA